MGLFANRSDRKRRQTDQENAVQYARIAAAGIQNTDLGDELFDALKKQHIQTAEQICQLGSRLKTGWVARKKRGQKANENGSHWTLEAHKLVNYTLTGQGTAAANAVFQMYDAPLFNPLAYFTHQKNLAAVDFLLNKGTDPNSGQDNHKKKFNKRAIYYALKQEELLRRLLDGGAEPTASVLKAAVDMQALPAIKILLEYGAPASAGKSALADHINDKKFSKKKFDAIADLLALPQAPAILPTQQEPKPVATKKPAPPMAIAANDTQPQQDPNQVTFESTIVDRTMQEVFNFVSMERITLIRKSPQGPVETVMRDPFDTLQDTASLKRAFEEHQARGGQTPEERVFTNLILKPRTG